MFKIRFIIFLTLLLFSFALAQDTRENAEFKLAINLYNEGFYELAIAQLKKFIDSFPDSPQNPEARFYLGMAYFKLRKFEDARLIFQDFALSRPNHPRAIEALWKVGECFAEMKKYNEAGSAFERVKLFYPKSQLAPKALIESARYFEMSGDLQNTKKVLTSLIQEYPDNEFLYNAKFKIADILLKEGNLERALVEYKKIYNEVEDKNLKLKARLNIAKINSILGKSEEAEKIFNEIISQKDIDPGTTAEAYFELGKLQGEFGEYETGINYTLKALSTIPTKDTLGIYTTIRQKILLQLATYYFNIADYQNSIKFYNQLINTASETENDPEFLFNIAIAFDKILNYEKANEFYIKIINFDTTALKNPKASEIKINAMLNLANNYLLLGKFDEAIEIYKKYFETYPTHSAVQSVLFKIAQTYEEKIKDYKKAIFYYTELINRFPRSKYIDESLYHIGLCHLKRNETEEAKASFETLASEYMSSEFYESALEKLETLRRTQTQSQVDQVVKIIDLISDVLANKPRGEIFLKIADFYNFSLKDYANALRYYNLAVSEGNFDNKTLNYVNYQKSNCAYYLFAENKMSSDSAKNIIQNFINSTSGKDSIEKAKVDTAIFYLYKVQTSGLNQDGRRKIASEFLNKYPNSKFVGYFLIELINYSISNGLWKEAIKISTENFNKFDKTQIPEVLFKRAYAYYKDNDKQKSLADLNLLLKNYPSNYNARALDLQAQIFKEVKAYSDAVNVLREIEKNYFYTDLANDLKLKIADIYFESRDYIKAINEYKSYLSLLDFSSRLQAPEVIFKIASAYQNLGDIANAKKYYKLYLSTPKPAPGITLQAMLPSAGEAYYALGNIYRSEGINEKAVYYFEKAGKFNSKITKGTTLEAGDILFENERYDEALKKYNEALKLAENDSEKALIQSKAIICYYRMNDIDNANKAINSFKQTFSKLDIKNYLAEFQIELAGYYIRNKDNANAKKILDEVIKNYSNTKFENLGRYWMAKLEEINGNSESALKYLTDLNKKPLDKDLKLRVNLSLGNIYFKLEKYDSATIFYRFVVETSDEPKILKSAMNNLLACYEELGYYELALGIARKYIEKFPNAEDLIDKKIKIGLMYEMLGNYDLALSYFQSLLEEADKDLEAELHYYIGEVLYYKGEYEQAILEFLKVPFLVTKKTKIDWTANAFYMAGQSYEKMKKYEQAINMYQQIIDRPGIDPIFKSGAQKEIERVKSLLKQ